MTNTEEIKKELTKNRLTRSTTPKKDLLSTGSTLLNLACTGQVEGGFFKGGYFLMVGDSQSGKTFLSRTCLAEASINPNFKDYRLIYDDAEGGALMDTRRYFGNALADRIEPPAIDDDGFPIYSETIEDFYFYLDDALNHKRPCIYIEDSMDSLGSKYERSKFDEKKKESRGGKKAKGDYGDGKAKLNSSGIRNILPKLRDTGSILIILNQTRDNIGGSMFEPAKTRSGGHALTFYATIELWSSLGTALKRPVRGKDRKIGITSKIHVKKNRSTGRDRQVKVPIYYSYGIDDLGGCVDYLVEEGHWKKNKPGVINASDFDVEMKRDRLVHHIEEENCEFDLKMIVAEVWKEIETACEVKRKNRYD